MLNRLVRWYRAPAGLVSLAAMAIVVVLAVVGLTAAALLVTVAWFSVLLPHKFGRERGEWNHALARQAESLQAQITDSSNKLLELEEQRRRLSAELALMPTLEEIKTWQDAVERAQAAANASTDRRLHELDEIAADSHLRLSAVGDDLGSMDDRVGAIDDRVGSVHQSVEHLEGQVASVTSSVEAVRSELRNSLHEVKNLGFSARDRDEMSREIQAISAMYSLLSPAREFPPIGGWAVSAEAGLEITRLIAQHEPELVVETGSGTSTVLAAQALQKLGSGRLIALEHDIAYARKTRKLLEERDLDKIATVVVAPLSAYRINSADYSWYELEQELLTTPIGLLIVDGPPGTTCDLARYPAVPLLFEHLNSQSIVVIDDASREDERTIVERWHQDFGLVEVSQTKDGDLSVLRFVPK